MLDVYGQSEYLSIPTLSKDAQIPNQKKKTNNKRANAIWVAVKRSIGPISLSIENSGSSNIRESLTGFNIGFNNQDIVIPVMSFLFMIKPRGMDEFMLDGFGVHTPRIQRHALLASSHPNNRQASGVGRELAMTELCIQLNLVLVLPQKAALEYHICNLWWHGSS